MKLRIVILLAATIMLCGCLPVLCTNHAGVSGRVVDKINKQPIPTATVTLRTYSIAKNQTKTSQTLTGNDGSFEIKPEQQVCLYMVPMDPYPQLGKVTISASGYEEYATEFRTSTVGPSMTTLNVIPLTPHSIGTPNGVP